MTVTPTPGYQGWCKVGTTSNPTNKVAGLTDQSLPFANAMYNTSNMDAGSGNGFESSIPGLAGAKPQLKLWYDPTDTNGQLVLQNAWLNKTLLYFICSINGTNTATFTAWVANFNVHGPVNNANDTTVTLQMTGSVAFG